MKEYTIALKGKRSGNTASVVILAENKETALEIAARKFRNWKATGIISESPYLA